MAFQSMWYQSELSDELLNVIEKDIILYDKDMQTSMLSGSSIDYDIRKSKNTWIPTSHWIGGLLWHYIRRANDENFFYDIDCIEGETIQYTQYGSGEYYGWHQDSGIVDYFSRSELLSSGISHLEQELRKDKEKLRKLSVILQLSSETDYRGGQVQFLDERGKSYFAPKTRGTVIVFDSRTRHRVRKIKEGTRKSLVGWVIGPRWK